MKILFFKKHLILSFFIICFNICFSQCVTEVWGGARHCIALRTDSTVWTWGAAFAIGDGSSIERDSPVEVHDTNNVGFLHSIIHVLSGEAFCYALKADGTVWSWGINGAPGFTGTLGDGVTTAETKLYPGPVILLDSVIALGGRGYFSLCIRADSSVWGWGSNLGGAAFPGGGELGMDTAISHGSVVAIRINGIPQNARQVTGGGFHSLVLLSDHTLVAFGNNYFGELGVGDTTSRSVPTPVVGLSNVTMVSAGWQHTVALRADSMVWTWGKNGGGELGTGDTLDRHSPVQVTGLSGIIAVSGGDNSTLALKSDGTVWAWGGNERGECGDGTNIKRLHPVQVSGLTNIIYITARDYHNVAIKGDGTLWSWGWNINGQCGLGTNNDTIWTPQQVLVLGCTTTGIQSIPEHKQFKVYPNPATTNISIESTEDGEINIYNVQGQLMIKQFIQQGNKELDLRGFAKGIYILKFSNSSKTEVVKIVKE